MKHIRSKQLYEEGLHHLVGAVNSPVRAFTSVGGNPLFIEKAAGTHVIDVDKNRYVDLVLSYGPMILGHRHSTVQKALRKAIKKGYSFGATTQTEITLARVVCNAFPNIDKVRFVNSGTEAVMSAIRLARAYTQKDKIIKFSGCYHGHQDDLLVAAGSGLATLSMPGSSGTPAATVQNTLIADYNDINSVKKQLEKHTDIAAAIIEPVAGNMGVVKPEGNFLQELQALLYDHGALLIADEVMTGFRSRFGGAQEAFGIQADISCLGKVIGGGMPVGAYGARTEIMQHVAPLGSMYQAGTLSGNPIAMACGLATLKTLRKQNPYDFFEKTAEQIEAMLLQAASTHGVDIVVNRFGSMINPFFTAQPVTCYEQAKAADTKKYAVFFWEMIHHGVFLPPSQFEAWFLNTALTPAAMSTIEKAINQGVKAVAQI